MIKSLGNLVLSFVLFMPLYSRGQIAPIKFKHLTINEGLSQNTVYSIKQDSQGFVWVGTEDGLNRYNGYEFNIYKHDHTTQTLSNNQVTCLFEDKRKVLWIGTADGLNIYDRQLDQFKRIYTRSKKSSENNDFITAIVQDTSYNLWVGGYEGLKLYDQQKNRFWDFSIPNPSRNKLTNKILTLSLIQGALWIGTGEDLKIFDTRGKRYLALPPVLAQNKELRHSGIRAIKCDRQGNIWIGTESAGLYKYDPHQQTCINYRKGNNFNQGLLSDIVRDILVTGDDIWVGTREGLNIIHPGYINSYVYDKYDNGSIAHNSVRSFMKDRAGNIWVGTFAGGVNVFDMSSRNFINIAEAIGTKPGLSQRVVSEIIKNEDNSYWVGTEGGGLIYIDLDKNIFQNYPITGQKDLNGRNIIKSLSKDGKGGLWVGTYNGLFYFNLSKKTFIPFKYSRNENTPNNDQFYALHADGNQLCIGTNGAGLQFLDERGNVTAYLYDQHNPHSISSNNISALLYDHGNYWIGTQRGLNYFDRETKEFTRFKFNETEPNSLTNNAVLCLFKDAQQRLWIGTEGGGLNYYDEAHHRFYGIGKNEGLNNEVIHAINQDRLGRLWVSTNKGLFCLSFSTFRTPFKGRVQVTSYTITDGLPSNQFSNGSTASQPGKKLIFGSIAGITLFDPDNIITNSYKPPVVITDFLIKNEPVQIHQSHSPLKKQINETEEITLTHDQGFISFRFAALNFITPENTKYAYKLEGLKGDNGWHYVNNQRTATYTNLDAGRYVFKVKGANNDGVWNEQIKSIKLTVQPPWWKTWWAMSIYMMIVVLLLIMFYGYSVKTAKLTNALEFESLNHQKDQELAQRKLAFFTNISHEIKTPLTLILAPLEKLVKQNDSNNKIQNQLMLMQRNGDRLIKLINQLLDFRKFEEGNMKLHAAKGNVVKFIKEVVLSFEGYAQSKNINLIMDVTDEDIQVYFDRDKLEKILYNLISNALKFTPSSGKVNVEVKKTAEELIINVEDNGIGIAPEYLDRIFDRFNDHNDPKLGLSGTGIGLSFSQGLIQMHKGKLNVKSIVSTDTARGYTCFTIHLPLGADHLATEEIIQKIIDSEDVTQYVAAKGKGGKLLQIPQVPINHETHPVLLVVEDNPELLNFIAGNFQGQYDVHTAPDGQAGLELALTLIPDLVISDVMMPKMNGITLCSKLKTDTRTSHIPVILLTARTPLIFKLEGLETGADDYITKPFHFDILESRVRNLIESRNKLRERYRKEISLQPLNVAITSPDEKFITRVMSFIEQNIAEESLNVEELGKEIGMSRVTLYRKLKALTNQTPVEFIRSVRIKRAAQLLEQGKFNVSEVAYLVGFLDINYFRRCFKDVYGYTPTEYAQVAERQLN